MAATRAPIGIYYEHPEWFRPLFAELERRGLPYERLPADRHRYDATNGDGSQYSLVVNRMSPSAHLRGHGHGILYTLNYLAHLEGLGVRVVNGLAAFRIETSKALQLALLKRLGLPFPAARVINHASQAPAAAEGLRFPVVVKANIGGSGAGIVLYDSTQELQRAADAGDIRLGLDQTALVQEFIPARGGHITRVEVLNGRFLYAIHVFNAGAGFNLCPADICQTDAPAASGAATPEGACVTELPRQHIRVEGCTPPPEVIDDVVRIMAAAGIDVGGVEYLVDDRDGRRYYYDINALSNFVADAPRVVGFDPFVPLVDFLEEARS
jgi:hypothetical protein